MKLDKIAKFVQKNEKFTTQEVASALGVSRIYAHRLVNELIKKGQVIKIGSTRSAYYVDAKNYVDLAKQDEVKLKLKNENLKEHEVFSQLEKRLPLMAQWNENIRSIFYYAFTEMFNNAIDHSESKYIEILILTTKTHLNFHIRDWGIGVFKNVMKKKKLNSELEAIQDLLKGKTTTQPEAHSGEGIFFTSKIADVFSLESFDYSLIVENKLQDIFVREIDSVRGTKVTFSLMMNSEKHLNDIFKKYQLNPEEPGFDKTEIHVKLYSMGTMYISRSQAKRILVNLEKFKSVILDFDKVPTVGQAFADEVFRVFKGRHPEVAITPINMNETVKFMINRVRTKE